MISSSETARLQDEIYREMFRLEAGCPVADLRLAVALLRAWMVLERDPPRSRARQWLCGVCPTCLRMIGAETAPCASDSAGRPGGSVKERGSTV